MCPNCYCSNSGTERSDLFLLELEDLGFNTDEITFGILIGWNCHEGKLKNAFVYMSEMLTKSLKPNICSYNGLLSGVFKEGMWKHSQDILDGMVDQGIPPEGRQFDEVKMIVCKMASHGFLQLSSLEDPLSKAFMVLGFNPSAVRLKRDNDAGFSKTEFLCNLGNGLYLDKDPDEYDKTVSRVLEDSMLPDFNSLVMQKCGHGNFRAALELVNEMIRWGQEISLPVFSVLVKGLCSSQS